ncbi:hypothetical protein ACTWP5_24180 [Streptomyces sp. 4N509B]|uniref:hypothetical protein n=1 Tax=Streptomyces sp. 4N509B TaxID=3457413 RepID=UPI003FD670F2
MTPGGIIGAIEADHIHRQLAQLVDEHFPDRVVSFTSGSLPYGAAIRGRSDIDVNIVLPTQTRPDDTLFARISAFVDDYTSLHEVHGLRVDRRFPGEYFTLDQAREAAAGRGVPITDQQPRLPTQPDDAYWTTTEETWYLAWLGATAFSRRLSGDPDVFTRLRRQAWTTVVALCLPDLAESPFGPKEAMDRILAHDHPHGGFGVHPGYERFRALETHSCYKALTDLAARRTIYPTAAGRYRVDADGAHRWATDLAARHRTGFHAPDLLTVTSSLRIAR